MTYEQGREWVRTDSRPPLTAEERGMVADNAEFARRFNEETARMRAARNHQHEPAPIAGDAGSTINVVGLDAASIDERLRLNWEASAKIRAEFGHFGAYQAYMKADAAGQVKMFSPGAAATTGGRQPASKDGAASRGLSGPSVEERCIARWKADAAIRDEFGDLATYVAFTRADEAGLVRILGRRA